VQRAIIVAALTVGWLAFAKLVSSFMAGRGHRQLTWWLIGLVCGPFAALIALLAVRHGEPEEQEAVLVGRTAAGDVTMIAGIDGSPEAKQAVTTAVNWLGSRLSGISLVGIVDFDEGLDGGADYLAAKAGLVRAAHDVNRRLRRSRRRPPLPEAIVRSGPVPARLTAAADDGLSVLVVGRSVAHADRSNGTLRAILARSRVPVLVVPAGGGGHR
jgi:nucleotide-binding universal stress UspA family protein